MKTLIIYFFLTTLIGFGFAQETPRKASVVSPCTLIYSYEEDALVYKDNAIIPLKAILIESLPYSGKLTIPIYLSPNMKGTYVFKKHPALAIPEYYTAVIEDTFTGEHYDLKASDSCVFETSKKMEERFVLKMDYQKCKLTAMR